jgi:hypothetical protein
MRLVRHQSHDGRHVRRMTYCFCIKHKSVHPTVYLATASSSSGISTSASWLKPTRRALRTVSVTAATSNPPTDGTNYYYLCHELWVAASTLGPLLPQGLVRLQNTCESLRAFLLPRFTLPHIVIWMPDHSLRPEGTSNCRLHLFHTNVRAGLKIPTFKPKQFVVIHVPPVRKVCFARIRRLPVRL